MKRIKLVRNSQFQDPNVIAWIEGDMPSEIFADYLEEKGVTESTKIYDQDTNFKIPVFFLLRSHSNFRFSKGYKKFLTKQLKQQGFID